MARTRNAYLKARKLAASGDNTGPSTLQLLALPSDLIISLIGDYLQQAEAFRILTVSKAFHCLIKQAHFRKTVLDLSMDLPLKDTGLRQEALHAILRHSPNIHQIYAQGLRDADVKIFCESSSLRRVR